MTYIVGEWGAWAQWNACVCGQNKHTRTRKCNKNGNTPCEGVSQEEKSCDDEEYCFGTTLVTQSDAVEECKKLGRVLPTPRSKDDIEKILDAGKRRFLVFSILHFSNC